MILVAMLASGCASNARDGSLDAARVQYDKGAFNDAHATASQLEADTNANDRYEAAYLAGVSAYRMGDFDAAERHFALAMLSTNATIAGRSSATLGLIHQSRGKMASAAPLFRSAARLLKGDEAAIAARRASAAYRQLGKRDEANAMAQLANAGSLTEPNATATLTSTGPKSSNAGGYAIQFGAFSRMKNADELAASLERQSSLRSFGTIHIVSTERDGKTLHLVQLGPFDARYDAEQVRQKIGVNRAIVVARRD